MSDLSDLSESVQSRLAKSNFAIVKENKSVR